MNVSALFKNKTFRLVLIGLAALLLLVLVWAVFFPKKSEDVSATEREVRLKALLEELNGVEEATVMITEREGEPVAAVILFEGEDGILIRTRMMEIAARALSLRTQDICVYPAN